MINTLSRMIRTGILTEKMSQVPNADVPTGDIQQKIRKILGRALCIRHVDAGSCNGCELEIQALNNAVLQHRRHRDQICCESSARRPLARHGSRIREHGRGAETHLRCNTRSQIGYCRRRLRRLRRNLRRELRQQGRRSECHSRASYGKRLSAQPHCDYAGHRADSSIRSHRGKSSLLAKARISLAYGKTLLCKSRAATRHRPKHSSVGRRVPLTSKLE